MTWKKWPGVRCNTCFAKERNEEEDMRVENAASIVIENANARSPHL